MLKPSIREIQPSLIDCTTLTASTSLLISGENFREGTICRMTGFYPDGRTLILDTERIIDTTFISSSSVSFDYDLTTPTDYLLTIEKFKLELSTNLGHTWIEAGEAIQVSAFLTFVSETYRPQVNVAFNVHLQAIDTSAC